MLLFPMCQVSLKFSQDSGRYESACAWPAPDGHSMCVLYNSLGIPKKKNTNEWIYQALAEAFIQLGISNVYHNA